MPLECPPEHQDGPILGFLDASEPFDAVHLVHEQAPEKIGAARALEHTLRARNPERAVEAHLLPFSDPRRYADLYSYLRSICRKLEETYPAASFHVLLSPGTSQVHATWVLLAKTVFPARTWQTSEVEGALAAEEVHIPFDIDAELVEPARERAKASARLEQVPGLIYRSEAMALAIQQVKQTAEHGSVPLLLLGETGVGKERLARYAHSASDRREGPFIGVNCAALAASLVESELFGHEKGAFTHAAQARKGLFEEASGGTLFLDEIGELSFDVQAKLLRVLQERSLRRVGASRDIAIDTRIFAATHRNLRELVAQGRFREDLYYRLAVSPVDVPPLRERREDIRALADHFLDARNRDRRKRKRPEVRLSATGLRLLESYPWPGNVRELENTIERVAVRSEGGVLGPREMKAICPDLDGGGVGAVGDLNIALDELARRLITRALEQHHTQERAAQALGLRSGSALQQRMKTLGMTSSQSGGARRAQR